MFYDVEIENSRDKGTCPLILISLNLNEIFYENLVAK